MLGTSDAQNWEGLKPTGRTLMDELLLDSTKSNNTYSNLEPAYVTDAV
jgi:hypothetical protein